MLFKIPAIRILVITIIISLIITLFVDSLNTYPKNGSDPINDSDLTGISNFLSRTEDINEKDAGNLSTRSRSRSNGFINETSIYELEANSDVEIAGVAKWDSSGYSLAMGDIDGDGKMDMIIGAYDALTGPSNDRYSAGEVYVIFGASRSSLSSSVDLSSQADIVIYGVDEYDHAGETLAAGDINGDGRDDILIGIPNGDGVTNSVGQEDTGEVAVIYGDSRTNLGSAIDLNKGYDVIIYGRSTKDFAGSAVAVGNLNNDSFEDIIICAYHGDGPTGKRSGAGDVYVFFGKSKFSSTLKASKADFSIYGNLWGDSMGTSIAVDDIDNDNFDDMLIGSPNSFSGPGRNLTFSGECYVIFGDSRTNLGKSRDLENLSNADVTIYGFDEKDCLGTSVAIADLDGDGYGDLVLGAKGGDGPNNARSNAGDIYIIRGGPRSSLGSIIDLGVSSNVDLAIYGADPKDKAGSALDVGDFNGDGIDDLVFGSALADGTLNDEPSAGEAYLIHGNISLGAGLERDLGGNGADLIIYSTVEQVHAGFAVAAGDIDSDSRDDVLVGAPYSDVKDGAVSGAGKSYVIYGTKVLKRLKNLGLELDGVLNQKTPICYARNKAYTFVVNITVSIGVSDLNSVKVILDPGGLNIELVWTELTNEFSKNNDPKDFVELLSKSSQSNTITDTLIQLNFDVIFSGSYPDEGYSDVSVYSISDGGLKDTDRYNRIYRVENDLEYTGTLDVDGEFQGNLMGGSWIQSNESVTWKGLTVVYEGTSNIYPPNEYFEVQVADDDGDIWYNRSSSGSEFMIVSAGDAVPDFSDFYTLSLTANYPAVKVPQPIQYELKIASPNITYENPSPTPSEWFSLEQIICSVTVTDQSGGDLLGISVQFSVSTSGTQGYGLWQDAGIIGNAPTLSPSVLAIFDDGDDNYIKWRAKSTIGTLGDIYSGSEDYNILIDTSTIFFRDAFPELHQWQPDLQVACGITISDNWTGVDAATVEYAYTTSGLDSFTKWISAGLIEDTNDIKVEVFINFKEGTDNYIVWRANDVIGNGYISSEIYKIKVSTQKPITTLFLPVNNSELSSTGPELTWSGFDPNDDDIFYEVYIGTDKSKVENLDTDYRVTKSLTKNSLKTLNLLENINYYWTVIPSDGTFTGYCESGIWSFSVSLDVPEPEIVLELPLTNSITNQTSIDLVWSTDYIHLIHLEYHIYLDTNPVPLKLYKQVKSTFRITVEDLEENVNYYWTVIPVYNDIFGKCRSGIWSFRINRTYEQIYDIDLSVNATQITVPWNSSWDGYLELFNQGNGVELVELNIYAGALEPMINITAGTIMLQPFEILNFTINISIPDNFPVRSYNIIFQAVSSVSGERITFVLIVDVKGTEQYYKGFDTYDSPDDFRPFDDSKVSEEVTLLLRNIFLVAFALVITAAVTTLLIIRHSLNKANERAIIKLKELIEDRRKELEKKEGKGKPLPTAPAGIQPRPMQPQEQKAAGAPAATRTEFSPPLTKETPSVSRSAPAAKPVEPIQPSLETQEQIPMAEPVSDKKSDKEKQ